VFYSQCCKAEANPADRYCVQCGRSLSPAFPERGSPRYESFMQRMIVDEMRQGVRGPAYQLLVMELDRRIAAGGRE
jgi:hypothetical protein